MAFPAFDRQAFERGDSATPSPANPWRSWWSGVDGSNVLRGRKACHKSIQYRLLIIFLFDLFCAFLGVAEVVSISAPAPLFPSGPAIVGALCLQLLGTLDEALMCALRICALEKTIRLHILWSQQFASADPRIPGRCQSKM